MLIQYSKCVQMMSFGCTFEGQWQFEIKDNNFLLQPCSFSWWQFKMSSQVLLFFFYSITVCILSKAVSLTVAANITCDFRYCGCLTTPQPLHKESPLSGKKSCITAPQRHHLCFECTLDKHQRKTAAPSGYMCMCKYCRLLLTSLI